MHLCVDGHSSEFDFGAYPNNPTYPEDIYAADSGMVIRTNGACIWILDDSLDFAEVDNW